MCAPLLQDANSPLARLVGQLLSCLAKNMWVWFGRLLSSIRRSLEGDLLLTDGLLSGLAGLTRHQPTQITVHRCVIYLVILTFLG